MNENDRIRLCVLSENVGSAIRNILETLAQDVSIIVVTADERTASLSQDICVDYVDCRGMSLERTAAALCRRAKSLYENGEIDLVHGHSSRDAFLDGVPVVSQPHGCVKAAEAARAGVWWKVRKALSMARGRQSFSLIEERSVRNAQMVVAVSEANREELVLVHGLDGSRVKVVHNALPPRAAEAASESHTGGREVGPWAYYCGRPDREKGVFALVEQWQAHGEAEMPLALAGISEADLGRPRLAKGDRSRILPLGWLKSHELAAVRAAARVLVHPSLREGFSMTILEAMSCGHAIVAFDIPAIREATGADAILVKPGDWRALVLSAKALAGNESNAKEQGKRLQERARMFTASESVKRLVAIYRLALNGGCTKGV